MMEDVKIMDAAALTDEKLTKSRAVVSVLKWWIPDEENILEALEDIDLIEHKFMDNVPNMKIAKNSFCNYNEDEESMKNHNNFDPFLDIKVEEFNSELKEEHYFENASMHSSHTEIETTEEVENMKMSLKEEEIEIEEHDPNSTDDNVFDEINEDVIPDKRINQNDNVVIQMNNQTQLDKESGPSLRGIHKTIKRKHNSSFNTKKASAKKLFACDSCEKKFTRNSTFQRHINNVHLKLKPFKCEYCVYSCSQSGNMKSHIKSVHLKLKPFKCEYCDYTCSESNNLNLHTKSVHLKLKPFNCEHCDYSCSKSQHLKKHIKSVHLKWKPFKCEHCDYTSSRNGNMKIHNESFHLQLKHFKCEHCDYTSSKSRSLKNHVIKTHTIVNGIGNENFFKCEICEFSSVVQKDVLIHGIENHKESESFKCNECKLYFTDKKGYLSHKRIKPFMCVECDSRFCEKNSLVDHMESCHNSFTDNCSECPATFTEEKSLTDHTNQVHEQQNSFEFVRVKTENLESTGEGQE